MRLEGRVAVVTGAAGDGIGRSIALAFAAEGADVAILDICPSVDTERMVRAHCRRAVGLQVDLRDAPSVYKALECVEAELGPIQILVNNAATIQRKHFLEVTLDEWDEVHAVDLRAYFVTGQWVARRLVAQAMPGSIVNIASVGGMKATLEQSHYCAAKGGVIALTRSMAAELAPMGIRVNAISPGVIESDFNRTLLAAADFRAMRAGRNALRRIGNPSELAASALLLASDDSSFIVGANLVVDGGEMVL